MEHSTGNGKPRSVVVVGAGLGGLAAALRLRHRGFAVRVLEKNARVGGKMNLIESAGYSFDTGPSLLTMVDVLRDLFHTLGERLEDHLDLIPLEPVCRYAFPDGTRLDASANLSRMVAEIERVAPDDVAGFFRFLSYGADLYTATAEAFLFNDFRDLGTLWKSLTPRLIRQIPRLATTKTVDDRVAGFFKSPHLRQLFNRYATYNGSSPYRASATFCLIPYVEFALGGWYPLGGMYRIADALFRLAGRMGIEFEFNTPAREIAVADGRVTGVVLADGRTVAADIVLANTDSLYTYKTLIRPEARKVYSDRKLDAIEPSCSGFMLLLGVRKKLDQLAHHNIFFSRDYPREFRMIFDELTPPDDPTIYICATSRSDESQAPPGCENLFVMVNAPHVTDRVDWDAIKHGYRDRILDRLEAFGIEPFRHAIETEHILTPKDLEGWFNAHRGAIYGLSSNQLTSAFLRPPVKARDVRGLYFAGGSTHPGGGVPLVLLSGKIAAERIANDVG